MAGLISTTAVKRSGRPSSSSRSLTSGSSTGSRGASSPARRESAGASGSGTAPRTPSPQGRRTNVPGAVPPPDPRGRGGGGRPGGGPRAGSGARPPPRPPAPRSPEPPRRAVAGTDRGSRRGPSTLPRPTSAASSPQGALLTSAARLLRILQAPAGA